MHIFDIKNAQIEARRLINKNGQKVPNMAFLVHIMAIFPVLHVINIWVFRNIKHLVQSGFCKHNVHQVKTWKMAQNGQYNIQNGHFRISSVINFAYLTYRLACIGCWLGCWGQYGKDRWVGRGAGRRVVKPLGQAARREKRRGRVEGQKSPKIEKMAILSGKLAILGHFSRFSADNHLDTCFNDQQDFMF